MPNNQAVEQIIKERGLTKQFIAQKLGVSRQAFSAKLHGRTRWSAQDIGIIKELFDLTPEEAFDIFLPAR